MQNFRMCQELGHQNEQVSHLCKFGNCDQNIFLCVICLKIDKHNHGLQKLKHILTFDQFQELSIKQQATVNDYNQQREEIIKKYQHIEEEYPSSLIKKLQKQKDFQAISQFINRVKISAFFDFEREQVKQILYLKGDIVPCIIFLEQVKEYFQKQYPDKWDIIKYNLQIDPKKKKDNQQIKQYQDEKFQQYQVYNIFYEHTSIQKINTVVISPDENFLVYGEFKQLTIIDLQTGQTIKQIKTQSSITACGFTLRTNKLFAGDEQGHLYYFDHNFNIIYNKQVHQGGIKGISLIDDRHILSFCSKNKIRLSDLQANEIQVVQKPPKYELTCVEYKVVKDLNLIICCTKENDITFYSADNGKLLLLQGKLHYKLFVQQLLPIKSRDFITANIFQIIIWNVSKEINKLHKKIQIEINLIYNVSLVRGKEKILIITKNSIELFDIQKQQQQQLIEISKGDQKCINSLKQIQQVDSINYIIYSQEMQIQILKRQE